MRVCIVGGVAGGATVAARLRRLNEDAEIIVFERGDYISYANCGLPYYLGATIKERDNLFVQTPERFKARLHRGARGRRCPRGGEYPRRRASQAHRRGPHRQEDRSLLPGWAAGLLRRKNPQAERIRRCREPVRRIHHIQPGE